MSETMHSGFPKRRTSASSSWTTLAPEMLVSAVQWQASDYTAIRRKAYTGLMADRLIWSWVVSSTVIFPPEASGRVVPQNGASYRLCSGKLDQLPTTDRVSAKTGVASAVLVMSSASVVFMLELLVGVRFLI